MPPWIAVPVRVLVGAGAAWLVLSPLVPHALGRDVAWTRAGLVGAATGGVWTVGALLARRHPIATWVPALLVGLVGTAILLLEAGHSASMAMAAGALASSAGAVSLVGWLTRGSPFPGAAVPAAVLPFAGLLLAAHGYLNYGSVVRFPAWTAVALAASPLAGLAVPSRLQEGRRWILGAVLAVAVAAILVGLALWAAPLEEPEAPW